MARVAASKVFELTLQRWNVMQTAVQRGVERVGYTANWRAICREFDLGDIDTIGKSIRFTAGELQILRELVKGRYGLDLLLDKIDGNRLEVAAQTHKEKLAPITPDANYVLCRWPCSHVLSHALPDGGSLRLPLAYLVAELTQQDSNIDTLLIVENLDVFDHMSQVELPEALKKSLMVYRGSHIYSPAGVKRLLDILNGQLRVCAFVDLDPAGVEIALSLGADEWLFPKDLDSLLRIKQINDVDDFAKQHQQTAHVNACLAQNKLPTRWSNVWQWMHQHRISIKQQHFLAHKLPLAVYQQE